MTAPIRFAWDGEAMVPRSPQIADKTFVVGEVYPLIVHEDRSTSSHNHYFASVAEAWRNLPEGVSERFPTAEHLRKRALIDCGYYDEEIIDCGSNKVAPNVAAVIRKKDDFAVIYVRDQFVIIHTAKSQSRKAMGAKDFQKSKQDVLDLLATMTGTTPQTLTQEAGKAA